MAEDLCRVCDFSTYYVHTPAAGGACTPQTAAQLLGTGVDGAILGYDSAADSRLVLQYFLDAGLPWWDAYRFMYRQNDPGAQVADVIAGIHAAPRLSDYLWLDVEPQFDRYGNVSVPPVTIAQLETAMDRLDAEDVRPGSLVKPGIYSAEYVWNGWFRGYTGPADRGYVLWFAAYPGRGASLEGGEFGGWAGDLILGHQYGGSRPSPIGEVDDSVFRIRQGAPPTPPPTPPSPDDPYGGVTPQDVRNARDRIASGRAALATADMHFGKADENLRPYGEQ